MRVMTGKKKNHFEDYEIDLADYVRVLLEGKWLILGVTVIAVAVAVGLSFVMPKIYKVETSLEMGRVGKEQAQPKVSNLVEEPSQLVEKISSGVYDTSLRETLGIAEADFPEMKAENPKDTALVSVWLESADPQRADDILDELNKLILADHEGEIKTIRELLENDVSRLETKIASVEIEEEVLEAKVAGLQAVSVYNQTIDIQNALWEAKGALESKKQEVENLYSSINSSRRSLEDIEPTAVVKSPVVPSEPIRPRPLLNGIISAILGLFLGTLITFGREWWVKSFR
jgi:uncharacterized protein involved in exopolysaccharide biosynthesis